MPTAEYPDLKPNYQLRNPRGLDDSSIENIRAAIEAKLNESVGLPVVFDLIDVVREHLTKSNLPSGQCVVCLYGFQEGDAFTKTECYHYLHSYCLARHLNASKKNYDEEQEKLPAWQRITSKPYQVFDSSFPLIWCSLKMKFRLGVLPSLPWTDQYWCWAIAFCGCTSWTGKCTRLWANKRFERVTGSNGKFIYASEEARRYYRFESWRVECDLNREWG